MQIDQVNNKQAIISVPILQSMAISFILYRKIEHISVPLNSTQNYEAAVPNLDENERIHRYLNTAANLYVSQVSNVRKIQTFDFQWRARDFPAEWGCAKRRRRCFRSPAIAIRRTGAVGRRCQASKIDDIVPRLISIPKRNLLFKGDQNT